MASVSEIQSLNSINYKSKIKFFFILVLVIFLFVFSFLNFYPVGDKIKELIKSGLQGRGCNPDFDEIRMEWIIPKIIISNLVIPARCLDRVGEPLNFPHVTLNFHLINFAPFGLPFRLDTDLGSQPISMYYVVGFNQHLIRLKDQQLNLSRLQPYLGNLKLAGSVQADVNLSVDGNRNLNHLSIKAKSRNLQIPSQNLQGLTTPNLKINEFFLEANSQNPPRIIIDKLILGDTNSPIRANFKGKIDLQEGNIAMSPLDLNGEIAFSEAFVQSQPLIDMMFQTFNQKDGFYQVRLGGTLGAPKPIGP
jgi:type II secretion system protein N